MPSSAQIASVTQIPGVFAAHATNGAAGTGCTVIICPSGATGGVDVRGGAPATRETDLLRPEETVDVLHSVVLSGGSAFGLAAACGVADELERRGIGLDVGVARVPIVSGACLFDLACGDPSVRPTADDGRAACARALDDLDAPLARGNVGAGTGCTVGKLAGPERAMKGGLGEDVERAGELVCGAVSAVNACGDVRDPDTGEAIAGMRDATGGLARTLDVLLGGSASMPLERTNTTISCVVTNARLTKAQATKVAQMAADAYAHAISPTHTTNDGDTVFVMATGAVEAPVDVVGSLATRALGRAIADGARQAATAYGYPAASDL
ncbi:P1 family peptidase [Thermophilibacter provencensis]|uniref:P1 family peptidase n=1 Tax=Thermophilibacter provencensis TaxID=1852386 RepID=UPI00094B7140|nr:P1 family peptidase [Thermophilibacter provencensis]